MNKIDFVHKMLYDDQKLPKIQNPVFSNEVLEVLPAERCQEGLVVSAMKEIVGSEEIDWNEIPSTLCAAEAQVWSNEKVDL